MQISNFVLYGSVEAFTLVCIIAIILLAYILRLKRRAKKVQEQTRALLGEIRQLKQHFEQVQIEFSTANAYKQQISDQLLLTREYHKSLDPDQDIALDLNTEVPLPRQIAAFRHALLVAEKEALHNSTDGSPNWKVLEAKFSQIIQFYADLTKKTGQNQVEEPAADQQKEIDELKHTLESILQEMGERAGEIAQLEQDLETAHKRVSNLEKFKKLFFEMEDQWKEAKQEAQIYYERLNAMRDEVKDTESFDEALQKYNNVYNSIERTILSNTGGLPEDDNTTAAVAMPNTVGSDAPATTSGAVEILNSEKRALDELKKLRNLTADQHRLINQLQKKLEDATTMEEKIQTIEQLEQELKRQVGYVKESEICIQLLEEELSRTVQRAQSLESELESTRQELEHIPKMQATIRQFTVESKEMLKGLAELEKANESLAANPQANVNNADQLAQMHKQLQALQAQYADLEERYLEVRANH